MCPECGHQPADAVHGAGTGTPVATPPAGPAPSGDSSQALRAESAGRAGAAPSAGRGSSRPSRERPARIESAWYSGDDTPDERPRAPGARDDRRARQRAEVDDLDDTTRTEVQSEWSPGSVVAGKYEVISRLGAGGFGTVYKVRHRFRKKYYALKTPHPEFARDDAFRVRFEREIEAMERFVHSDAVMIRDSGVTDSGLPYYTMDFIEGDSLKVVLRREGRLAVDRVLRIIRRVLRVLEVAHAHQIIHRDIKPDNVLVTTSSGRETVKVLDFGVAKLLDIVGDTGSVSKGMRVGTPKYMSPEQITGEALDQRSDIFSLGIVFYELITGEHPFANGSDPVRVTAAILNRDPVPPREIVPEIPRVVSDHILWMLEKRPRRRPESAEVLSRQLGRIDDGVSRVAPIETLEVCPLVPRAGVDRLVFLQEASVGEFRYFLFFTDRLTFGRSNDTKRGITNDVILRALPCRSRQLDPESWQRNLTISQRLGSLGADGASVLIEPDAGAKYGIGIGGVRCFRPVRTHADRFHLSLGDRALELDGHRMLRATGEPEFDLAFLSSGRPRSDPSHATGYSNPDCDIDHIHLRRANNWPYHEYFQIFRELDIGSSMNAGLRLLSHGVEAQHALILYEAGEAFLLSQGGSVFVRCPHDEQLAAARSIASKKGEFCLPPRMLLPLVPGLELVIGDALLRVASVEESHFKML